MESRIISSFGELLRTLRRRQHLTQQQLAEQLGVHRSTIGTWERGEFLPESRGMVLELARLLRLGDQETLQLLEASLTALAPYWSVPYPRNPFFTGREEILEKLHRRLGPDQAIALTQAQALSGLGGIGKTQVAIEYAYRHALEYSAVFWIGSETVETILASFLHIARVLQLAEYREADQQHIVMAVQRWLSTHSGWLLIWDNVEDLEVYARFLPMSRQGAVLLTTRMQALGVLAQGFELAEMEQAEAILFVLRRAKFVYAEATAEQMPQLAQELWRIMGGLPLALDQAGAYIEETGCSLSDYLQRFKQQRTQLLDRRGLHTEDHPRSVSATLLIANQQVKQCDPLAADILSLCTFLHADAIPEEIFLAGGCHLEEIPAGGGVADPSQLDTAMTTLRTLSLVQRHPETHTLFIHRLMQAVLQEQMSEQEQTELQQRTIHLLNAQFPEVTPQTWEQCERLLPHVVTCAASIPGHSQNQELAQLLRKAANYLLQRRARYEQAEQLYRRALWIWEQTVGTGHPNVAALFDHLAHLYVEQGKYEQAEQFYLRAIQLVEHSLGQEHPDLARPLNNLALLYHEWGRYERVQALYERALRIRERAVGPDHPDVVPMLDNLARLYKDQGQYMQAESLYQRALRIWKQALGCEHPYVSYLLNGVADLYARQRKDEQAEALYQQVLQARERAFGPEHPRVADPLKGLADLYAQQKKYRLAETLYQRALTIRERQQSQHPETARTLADLAMLYEKLGKAEQAEPLLQRACAILEQRFGQMHPETRKARSDYLQLLERRKRAREPSVARRQQSQQRHVSQSDSTRRGSLEESWELAELEADPLKDFLVACCERHPRAWCRSADLWQAYQRWAEERQERFPLTRRAFAAQLKAHGYSADRTKAARIWCGITIACDATR